MQSIVLICDQDMSDNGITSVSVAMCTFNGSDYLKEQLESILCQTVLPNELVVCDDCSTDDTVEILKMFSALCAFPVKLYSNHRRLGITKNFEKAISNCSGDIIILADQDDVWFPNKVERMVHTFRGDPDCGFVFSNAGLIDSQGLKLDGSLWSSRSFDKHKSMQFDSGEQLSVLLKGGGYVFGMTLAFRSDYRSILLPINSESSLCTHDTWIVLILSAIGVRGISIKDNLVNYRQHAKQVSGAGQKTQLFGRLKVLKKGFTDGYDDLAGAFDRIAERVSGTSNMKNQRLLLGKSGHLRARSKVNHLMGLSRIKPVLTQLFLGHYAKFSSGLISPIVDLMARSNNKGTSIN